ncbi:MAG: DUF1624 domain-containing protein [Propionibacteriales bacterium]|nr:DUF1624 domain-containing protein [Propionibacteriales bacterium]
MRVSQMSNPGWPFRRSCTCSRRGVWRDDGRVTRVEAGPATSTAAGRARIVGIDMARCLALLGMISTHVIDPVGAGGDITWHQELAGGRSSALFAMLAGLSLALVTGRETPFRGRAMKAARAGIAVRALLIGLLGLWLGGLDTGIAVILVYYAVLFVLALPFLGLSWRTLAFLALAWAATTPVANHVIRPVMPETDHAVPNFVSLVEPVELLTSVLFTGYYPTFCWLAYALAGLAIGRLPLRRVRVAVMLTVTGAFVAALSWGVSWILLHPLGGLDHLADTPSADLRGRSLDLALQMGIYGTTPTDTWWWLAVFSPHTGTPFDLLFTTGNAMVVIGLCLLVGKWWPRLVGVVFAVGGMTLTFYSLHLVALHLAWGPERGTPALFWWHAAAILVLGAVLRLATGRGPLEAAVSTASREVSNAVRAPSRPAP